MSRNLRLFNLIIDWHVNNDQGGQNNYQVMAALGVEPIAMMDSNIHFREPRSDGYANAIGASLSFQQWQSATGFDANSENEDPQLDANYAPVTGSPAVDTAFAQGTAQNTETSTSVMLAAGQAANFAIGDMIEINGELRTIVDIVANALTVDSAISQTVGDQVWHYDPRYGVNRNRGAIALQPPAPPPQQAITLDDGVTVITLDDGTPITLG